MLQAHTSASANSNSSSSWVSKPPSSRQLTLSSQQLAVTRIHSRRMHIQCKAVELQDDVLPQQQQNSGRVDSPGIDQGDVFLPSPSNMQAQVMLVPKKTASTALLRQKPAAEDPLGKFLLKCKLAWNLFFPPQHDESNAAATPKLSPKDLGKQRLQMILVADRCGLSPNSLVEMKKNTLAALADCMDLEDLQDAHLRFTMTREGGTTYSMAVPILRPGPYAEDGSVVGQGPRRAAAGPAGAVMTAAAAAAAAGWEDYRDDSDQLEYDYEIDQQQGQVVGADQEAYTAPVLEAVYTAEASSTADNAAECQQPTVEDSAAAVSSFKSASAAQAAGVAVNKVAGAGSGDESDSEHFKEQFRELLVDELVQDVGTMAQHSPVDITAAAPPAAAVVDNATTAAAASSEGSRSSNGSPIMGLSEQELREVAAKEVQRLVAGDQDTEQQ